MLNRRTVHKRTCRVDVSRGSTPDSGHGESGPLIEPTCLAWALLWNHPFDPVNDSPMSIRSPLLSPRIASMEACTMRFGLIDGQTMG